MSEANVLPEIGTLEFWRLYDEFCTTANFVELSEGKGKQTKLCLRLQEILRTGHTQIARLPREDKGWQYPKAWLVMRGEQIISQDGGYVFMYLEPGDVMTWEFQWDRDVFVTHVPIREWVSGQFLSQSWPGAGKGLFLPLYEKETIMAAINAKLDKNRVRAVAKAVEEADEWGWY